MPACVGVFARNAAVEAVPASPAFATTRSCRPTRTATAAVCTRGRGGKLDLHLDYSIHPLSGLERRFNLSLPNKEPWQPEYGGSLDLYAPLAEDASKPGARVASVLPCFNRALLFSTTAPSFHGFPSPIACPDDWRRNSLALYYLTPPRPEAPKRSKALYVAAPGQPHDPELERLRHIRATRRLEPADFESV